MYAHKCREKKILEILHFSWSALDKEKLHTNQIHVYSLQKKGISEWAASFPYPLFPETCLNNEQM